MTNAVHECKIEIKNTIELFSKTKGFLLIQNVANNAQYEIGYIFTKFPLQVSAFTASNSGRTSYRLLKTTCILQDSYINCVKYVSFTKLLPIKMF